MQALPKTANPKPDPPKPKRRWVKWVLLATAVVLVAIVVAAVVIGHGLQAVRLHYSYKDSVIIYAMDHEGMFPPLVPRSGVLMYDVPTVNYLMPGAEYSDEDTDDNFFYFGYVLTNEAEMRAFAEAYKEIIASGGNFEDDLVVPEGTGNLGSNKIYRIRHDLLSHIEKDLGPLTTEQIDRLHYPLLIGRPWSWRLLGTHVIMATNVRGESEERLEWTHGPAIKSDGFPISAQAFEIIEDLDNYEE